MNKLQLFSQLTKMSDETLVDYAEKKGLSITVREAKKLRRIFSGASIHWLAHGIPDDVLTKTRSLLGSHRYQKLLQLLS